MALPLALPIEPMLARSVPNIPEGRPGEFAYEPKWDGFRCIVARDGDHVDLWSRSRKRLTEYFPDVADAARRHLPPQVVLDAELIVRTGATGAERLDWEALSLRIHPARKRVVERAALTPAELVCFDLLALADVDLTSLPQATRRDALAQVVGGMADAGVHLSRTTNDAAEARAWFERFEGAGLDGVVAKPTASPYAPGRRTMLKVKHERTAEAVVIGYGRSRSGHGVGSLHLGLYTSGVLVPVGGIGALPDAARAQLVDALAPLVLTGSEADAAPAPAQLTRAGVRDFVPLRPELVVEVAFDQLEGARFRHAVTFRRWRPDRDPESCLLDQIERAPAYDLADVLG
ncbi:ATP-dependent DNA ligase [Propioniciclava soli]|uniref:DNA ligase (ATP) n=1 Tax=Propioniciclava soli TaxID=2775081 RepID=A0ABZ3C9C0_9ACTN|nr:ATP-dependent DNA ligase [Propioniciclava soli]